MKKYSFVYHTKVDCKAYDQPLKSYIVYDDYEDLKEESEENEQE